MRSQNIGKSNSTQANILLRDVASKLPSEFRTKAEVVFVTFEDMIGRIGAEQPGPVERDLIANTEAVLRVLGADAVILEGLHHGHLEDELLIQIEEILQAKRAAEGVGAGVVEFRDSRSGRRSRS